MNLYVSNLDIAVTEKELNAIFTQQGEVSTVKIITDYSTGRSRGFAFIEMPNDHEGQKAIKKINGKQINDRNIAVQVARPKEDNPQKSNYSDRNSNSNQDRSGRY